MEEQLSPLIPGGQPGRPLLISRDHDREDPEASPSSPQARDGKPDGWRPVSLTRRFLLGTIALSLVLVVVIEVLAQATRIRGGLAFYASIDDIPAHINFAYSYLPTIVATLYSFLWNWIDLDVKRVQPWIEVSKPGGAAAASSLLIDYTSDFLPAAPIRAARQRHWLVVFSGTAVVLILYALTPVQTSLLGVSIAQRHGSAVVTQRSQLLPVDQQPPSSRPAALLDAIERFDMTYPAFTTSEYALLPFYLDDSISASSTDRNWTAETTKIWAEVDCSPVKVIEEGRIKGDSAEGILYFIFNTTGGCSFVLYLNMRLAFPHLEYSKIRYIGDCPKSSKSSDNQNLFLAYWAALVDPSLEKSKDVNLTTLLCDLSFYKQHVRATLDSFNLQSIGNGTTNLQDPETLGSEEFNFTSYFYSGSGLFAPLNENEDWGGANAGGLCKDFCRYAMSRGYEVDAESLSDPSILKELAESYQQQFFSLTVSDRLTDQKNPIQGPAESSVFQASIIASRTFSIVSEVLLLLAAFSLGFIYYFTSSFACVLSGTPSSIADLIDIAHHSPEIVKLLENMDTADEQLLLDTLGATGLQLTFGRSSIGNRLIARQAGTGQSEELYHTKRPKPYYKPIKPWVLRRLTGGALVAVLVAGIAFLSYLKAIEWKEHGLQRPTESFEVLQLLENYIPTVFATGMEPFWILLTRTMCVYQPFKDLWKGHSRAARSVEATHTSVPPQLALFKAIASRHFVLSLLCLATLLANVLAVGLSALFIERPVFAQRPRQLDSQDQHRLMSSKIEEIDYYYELSDPMDLVWANKTYGSRLPPWVSTEFFFQPLTIVDANRSQPVSEYTVRTRGFGAEANCTTIPVSTHRLPPSPGDEKQDKVKCIDPVAYMLEDLGRKTKFSLVEGSASMAYMYSPKVTSVQSGLCSPSLTFAWAKAPDGIGKDVNVSTSYATCQPFLQTAMFDVTVDRNGYVVRYYPVSNFQTTLVDRVSTNRTNRLIAMVNGGISEAVSWENTSVTPHWISQFIYLDTESKDFLDPKSPAPDPSELIPSIERGYSQLFAAVFFTDADGLLEGTEATVSAEHRIFLNNEAFIMTMIVLTLDLIIACVFYLPETLYILPRPPSSALSILAYIAPSRLVRDGTPPSGWKQQTFSFGRYVGHDGKGHIGIEMDPHVQIKDTSLGSYKPLLHHDDAIMID